MGVKKIMAVAVLMHLASVGVSQVFRSEPIASINSSCDEQNPRMSADGRYLFFTRSNHPQNVGGIRDAGDIWMATRNGTGWNTPVHGGALINDEGYNSVAGISADGKQLFLLYHAGSNGQPAKTQGLSVSTLENTGWLRPVNISIPYFHNRSSTISGFLSPDGQYLVYAADTYGTLGVEDIYVVKKENGNWGEPQNLGAGINTPFQELSPSLNARGDTLFFSSNGRKGKGSFDVYASARLDDTWTSWSRPVNLGDVNTEWRELYYVPLGNGVSLYSTTLNSDGYGDLRMGKYNDKDLSVVKDSSTVFIPITTPDNTVGDTMIRLHGNVQSAATGKVIVADITFVSASGNKFEHSEKNGYSIDLYSTEDYKVIIEARGFISSYETVLLSTYQLKDLELNFMLKPIEVGASVNLKSVLFKQSSTDMLAESLPELDVVASFMRNNPQVKIELAGHTDNRGVAKDNIKLSHARVEKVKAYLVSKGISSKRIRGKGYGGAKPIANSDSEESRKLNRRVEFTIVKD